MFKPIKTSPHLPQDLDIWVTPDELYEAILRLFLLLWSARNALRAPQHHLTLNLMKDLLLDWVEEWLGQKGSNIKDIRTWDFMAV